MSESCRPDLSPRQRDALSEVEAFHQTAGRPPTRAELGKALGVRAQTADFHLRALARKGYLQLERGARGIDLPQRTPQGSIPILGQVTAGVPIQAIATVDGHLPVPLASAADFALRVRGDSMRDAGILDGDLVLVRQSETADPRAIVVALLGEGDTVETTVKTYLPRADAPPILRAENPAYPDREIQVDEAFRLAGVVVGLYRDEVRSHA